MKWIKSYFKLTDKLAPKLAARQAYRVMSNPRVRKLKPHEQAILNQAEKANLSFSSFDIKVYTWGKKSNKAVLLLHGWEGHAGNFGAIIPALLEKGYYVISYDAPAHGSSSRGKTSMFEFADLATHMLQKYTPEVVISHSYGSVSAAFALHNNPEINVKHWFLVTTPHNFRDRIKDVITYVGATNRTTEELIRIIEKNTGHQVDALNMSVYGKKLHNLQKATIVHSKSDKVLPIDNSRKTHHAIAQSELIELDELGHYAILWAPELIQIIEARI